MKKRCFRFFSIADYEQEQKWLNEMGRNGWNLTNAAGIVYTFERGKEGEYIYKLDLPDERMSSIEVDNYYKFMQECGVEVVCTFKSWRYLRKKSREGNFEMRDNTYALLRMVTKALGMATRVINMLLVLFAILIVAAMIVSAVSEGAFARFMEGFATGMASSVIVALALIFVPISHKLRHRLNELVDELPIKG